MLLVDDRPSIHMPNLDSYRNAMTIHPNDEVKLAAYRDIRTKGIVAATLLIPIGAVAFFVLYCKTVGGEFSLNSSVEIGAVQRIALIVHGIYFMLLPFGFELMIEKLPFPGGPARFQFGKVPPRPDNLYWMMTCLSGELFFVGAVMFLLLASQAAVPRWALILPIAQCAYNMRNDLLWVGLGNVFSPIKKRIAIMMLDWVVIGTCFVIYILHFFAVAA